MAYSGGSGGGSALPIAAFREDITALIARHTVTIVKGDTGSGKSSQLPQYVLETSLLAQAVAKGLPPPPAPKGCAGQRLPAVFIPPELWGARQPNIYVTQPRRVAAVTLAKHVAELRGEVAGDSVGYRIGHDACSSAATRVTFCTTGWLLQWLVASAADRDGSAETAAAAEGRDRDALGATHIILDEVHERGIDTDLVCLVIKLALAKACAARARAIRALAAAAAGGGSAALQEAATSALAAYATRPRIVLMSATFDTRCVPRLVLVLLLPPAVR